MLSTHIEDLIQEEFEDADRLANDQLDGVWWNRGPFHTPDPDELATAMKRLVLRAALRLYAEGKRVAREETQEVL